MEEDDSILMKLFMGLPLLALGLFVFNHFDWVVRNSDYLVPVGILGGLIVGSRLFPEVWRQVRGAIPVLLILMGILGSVLYMIFGGGADAVVGFGAKAREQHIESLQ